jgi:hypothetical protein
MPKNITWVHSLLAAAGTVLVVGEKRKKGWLLLAFLVLYMVGISLLPLHWERWLLQILPVLAIFAAFGLTTVARWLTAWLARPAWGHAITAALAAIAHLSTGLLLPGSGLPPAPGLAFSGRSTCPGQEYVEPMYGWPEPFILFVSQNSA